ncbi:MAG: hypothetical protein ACLGG9_04705 [Thermoleophilia bacterium]|jgi:hypothetical protein
MRALPVWILTTFVVLSALLLVVGWDERHHAGWLPFIMGVVFTVFSLAAIGAKVRHGDDEA